MRRSTLDLIIPSTVTVLVITALAFGWLERLELITEDLRYRISQKINPAPIAIVAIDRNSLKSAGVWPMPRSYYADVLHRISSGGAKGILVDLDLSSVSNNPGEDEKLIDAVRESGNSVLAAHVQEKPGGDGSIIREASLPFPGLDQAAYGIGGIVFDVDRDGIVRRSPPTISFGDLRYLPMGIVGARMIDGKLPTDGAGTELIHFSLPDMKSIPVVSFVDVREGRFPEEIFRGRLVLIGAVAQELRDLWRTPLGILPGVYIHAAVIKSALNNSWYTRTGKGAGIMIIIISSLFLWWCLRRTGWKASALITFCYMGAIGVLGVALLENNIMIDVVPLFIVGIVHYPIRLSGQLLGSERALEHERMKAEVILKLGDLEGAEEAGQKPYLVPLVLLKQVLHVDQISLFLPENNGDSGPAGWVEEQVAGEAPSQPDQGCLNEAMQRNDLIRVDEGNRNTALYVPIRTVRKPIGVLFTRGNSGFRPGNDEIRTLMSFATQTGYFLESNQLSDRVHDLYLNTVKAISRAIDSRDHNTGAHGEHTVKYMDRFGGACGLTPEEIDTLNVGAMLHDIGKIGIPDSILLKKAALSLKEFKIMTSHSVEGHNIIKDLPLSNDIKLIVRHHHEHYDGNGYPDGMKGEEIPYLVRMFCIVDVFEALISARPYKEAMSLSEAKEEMRRCSGVLFDPNLVDVFLGLV